MESALGLTIIIGGANVFGKVMEKGMIFNNSNVGIAGEVMNSTNLSKEQKFQLLEAFYKKG